MAVRLTKEAMRANVDASGFDNALQVENRNQTLMIAHNVNKDASQDPIGKYWIEDRTDPMNPKGANQLAPLCFAFEKPPASAGGFFLPQPKSSGRHIQFFPPFPRRGQPLRLTICLKNFLLVLHRVLFIDQTSLSHGLPLP